MKITVFGGAQPKRSDPAYEEAFQLGRLLGIAGHTVLTGGYIGTMEAVSRGAAEAGGHVVGVTCEEIETWRQLSPNPWVQEEWHYDTLRERLFSLIDNCEVAIALPGGAGTLAEISLTWNMLIIQSLPPRPLILVGPAWQAVFTAFFANLGDYVTERDQTWLTFAPDIAAAVQKIASLSASKPTTA
ncbi:MAG TPA: LOG family protein [Anaerolineaceae bacterium]